MGLKLIGGTMVSHTQIILLVASNHLEYHINNFGTLKTYGMQPAFANPIVHRWLECFSSIAKPKYQPYLWTSENTYQS